jgi:hypothetical protein
MHLTGVNFIREATERQYKVELNFAATLQIAFFRNLQLENAKKN